MENKVVNSSLITFDLSTLVELSSILEFDLKPFLFQEMILKEKDFREKLKEFDFSICNDKNVCIFCSVDAIVPTWAYMLLAIYIQPFAKTIIYGNKDAAVNKIIQHNIPLLSQEQFIEQRVVIKGCGQINISEETYINLTTFLKPLVKSLFYGEPCSTVPLFKKKLS